MKAVGRTGDLVTAVPLFGIAGSAVMMRSDHMRAGPRNSSGRR